MSIIAEAARPWAPFAVGFAIGVGVSVWGVVTTAWQSRCNVQNPWDYDSEIAKAYSEFQRIDWNWPVIIGGPFVLGSVVWVVWFLLTLAAGMGGA